MTWWEKVEIFYQVTLQLYKLDWDSEKDWNCRMENVKMDWRNTATKVNTRQKTFLLKWVSHKLNSNETERFIPINVLIFELIYLIQSANETCWH